MKITLLCILLLIAASNLKSQQNSCYSGIFVDQGCTSFCLENNGYAIFGANYDFVKDHYEGLVIVNKRNLSKSFVQSDSPGKHVSWISKYGSVSFNFIASQTSWTGMNESGLVIYSMRLDEGSKGPEPDNRQWILIQYWLQYMLDNFSAIEEIIASDSTMRVFSSGRIPHYLVSDRYGNCATIEFIDGKMVTHTGHKLPVKVLANSSFDRSISEWESILMLRETGKLVPNRGRSSLGRFIRAADRVATFQPTDTETAISTAFDILKEVSNQTNWSIVFDTKSLQIHFKTIIHSEKRMIDFKKLDFSCKTPVKMIDINENLSGDITDKLLDYSFKYHFDHAVSAAKNYELKMGQEELMKYIRSVEEMSCLELK